MKNNKNKFKKPNVILYGLVLFVAKIITKVKFNLKIEKNEVKKAKGPYIIIANHESIIDFINMVCCTNRRLTFVISNSFYQSMKIQKLLKMFGVISKQQFQTNPSDLKKMKEAIKCDGRLVLYPAGLMTATGIATPVPEATGKFIKWLGADVYIAKIQGTYLTNPKWGNVMRKGKVTFNITKLFSKEQLNEYDQDNLQNIISQELYFDAYQNQENKLIKYKKGSNIEGLENVLYLCPKCKKEFTNKVINKNTLICEHCYNEVYSDEYGFLHPKTENDVCYKHPSDWYKQTYDFLYQEIKNNPNYSLSSSMTLKMLDYERHQFVEVSKGFIRLDKDQFTINYKENDMDKEVVVPIKSFPILPSKPGVHFEVQNKDEIYRCCLDNGKEVSKWIDVLNIFYNINNNIM